MADEKSYEVVVHKDNGTAHVEFSEQSNAERYAKSVSQLPEVKSAEVKEK